MSLTLKLTAAGILLIAFACAGTRLQRVRNEPNRRALLQIRETLEPGMEADYVRPAFVRLRTSALVLHEVDDTLWIIGMPSEFGATDWNLRLEFRNHRLAAVRVRTSDGPRPKDAPSDKSR